MDMSTPQVGVERQELFEGICELLHEYSGGPDSSFYRAFLDLLEKELEKKEPRGIPWKQFERARFVLHEVLRRVEHHAARKVAEGEVLLDLLVWVTSERRRLKFDIARGGPA